MSKLLKLISASLSRKPASKQKQAEPQLSILPFAAFGEALPVQRGPESGPDLTNQQTDVLPGCRFAKDVIAAGNYSHPVHGWKLDVDEKRMDKWCAAFDEMTKDGIKVPIYADHKPGAANHLGYLSALCRGGPEALKKYPELAKLPADKAPLNPKRLYAIHEFVQCFGRGFFDLGMGRQTQIIVGAEHQHVPPI